MKDVDYFRDKSPRDRENIDLDTAVLELTNSTNVRYNARDHTVENQVKRDDELDTDDWLKIIDKLAEEGVEQITLSGGEPTIRDDFYTILQYAINSVEEVVVQTNGLTNKKLSDHDCTVAIEIEAAEPSFNNALQRMTDPALYEMNHEENVLVRKEGGKCRYCSRELMNKNGFRMHVKGNHLEEAIEDVNQALESSGMEKISDWDGLKQTIMNVPEFDWDMFGEKEYDIMEKEHALQLALEKAEKIDNPTVLRCTVYNNNNLEKVMTLSEMINADTVFVPLRPVGRAKEELMKQLPSPGRMEDVVKKVYSIDTMLSTNHRVESPLYEAFMYRLMKGSDGELPEEVRGNVRKYWERGRVSGVGDTLVNVKPDGVLTPSPYIRNKRFEYGNILQDEWSEIYGNMESFNEEVEKIIEPKPAEGYDLRQPSIAADLDTLLNHPYKEITPENPDT